MFRSLSPMKLVFIFYFFIHVLCLSSFVILIVLTVLTAELSSSQFCVDMIYVSNTTVLNAL